MKRILILLSVALFAAGCKNEPEVGLARVFKYKMKRAEIIQLTDLEARISPNILDVANPDNYSGEMHRHGFTNATSSYMLRSAGKKYLFDAGIGGGLPMNLKGINEVYGNIDKIFLTHMHMDHIGGLVKYDKKAFPKAQLYIPKVEFEYWTSDENLRANENRPTPFLKAREIAELYKGQITLFEPASIENGGTKLEDGITAFSAHGHTPGHTVYLVESMNKKLLIWGDITHLTELQVEKPELSVIYDTDGKQAAATRLEVLEYAAENKIPVAGMHILYPGIGKISEKDGKYTFEPVKAKYRRFTDN